MPFTPKAEKLNIAKRKTPWFTKQGVSKIDHERLSVYSKPDSTIRLIGARA